MTIDIRDIRPHHVIRRESAPGRYYLVVGVSSSQTGCGVRVVDLESGKQSYWLYTTRAPSNVRYVCTVQELLNNFDVIGDPWEPDRVDAMQDVARKWI